MSHYSVAVLIDRTKTLNEILAPYNENLKVEPYIYQTKENNLKDAKRIKDIIMKNGKEYNELIDLEKLFYNAKTNDELINSYKSFYNDTDFDENDNMLSTYNPNSKWDWYCVGGRWNNSIKLNDGTKCNTALLKDIDFKYDKNIYDKCLRWWDVVINNKPLKENENKDDFINFYKNEYYINKYKNKETFAKINASFNTFAVVTLDGKWNEKGSMGWFGCSSETYEESLEWDLHYKEHFLDNLDENIIICVVDCHI